MQDVIKGTKILAKVQPGEGQTVASHQWTLDNKILDNITYELDTSNISIGLHKIDFYATNSCGNSKTITMEINIIEGIYMEQIDEITVNNNLMDITISIKRVANITVTVLDDPNGANPNKPINGATVEINGITGTTDTLGKVTISKVPFGKQIVKTTTL